MRRTRSRPVAAELPLTPMIDVVFLLLVFFLATVRPMDVLAQLQADRPAGRPGPVPRLRLSVRAEGFRLNDRPVAEAQLRRLLDRLGALDPEQHVLVVCDATAPHGRLIDALDACAHAKLDRISVVDSR